MSENANHPLYFTKLVLENIRSFSERQELTLVDSQGSPESWTLIVGDNGVGKTTLLQCLTRMRPVFNPPPEEDTNTGSQPIEPELLREVDNGVFDDLVRGPGDHRAFLKAEFSIGTRLNGAQSEHAGIISTKLEMERADGRIKNINPGWESSPDEHTTTKEPLVLAYGAGRHPKENGVNEVDTTDPTQSLFMVESALHDAEKLLLLFEFGQLKKRQGAADRLERLKCALAEILPDLNRSEDIEIRGPHLPGGRRDESGVWIKTSYGTVPLNQLSLGYRTVFAWIVDIASRMIEHFPNSKSPLNEPAIVIVDEIDLHMHPRWQWDIRAHLVKHFPKVQFIATAHSPLMAQVSLNAKLVVVQNADDHALICSEPAIVNGWRLDQVITSDLFGLRSARSPEVEKILRHRQELIKKETRSKDEQAELERLNREARDLPTEMFPEDEAAMDIIRQVAETLRFNGKDS